jgi:N-acetylmuramoyl-L-alanine amidase
MAKIAADHGFPRLDTIWDDSRNRSLKEKRKNPNVLYPGDVVFIPERRGRIEPGATEQRHRFVLKQPKVVLRLHIAGLLHDRNSSVRCKLHTGSECHSLTVSPDGVIEALIPAQLEQATLVVEDMVYVLRIGELDPAEEISGQLERLRNLGYYTGDSNVGGSTSVLASAVWRFQTDHRLEATGQCDEETWTKLKEVHGC